MEVRGRVEGGHGAGREERLQGLRGVHWQGEEEGVYGLVTRLCKATLGGREAEGRGGGLAGFEGRGEREGRRGRGEKRGRARAWGYLLGKLPVPRCVHLFLNVHSCGP